jgi:hypothetical protein
LIATVMISIEQQLRQLLGSGELDAAREVVDSLDISSANNINELLLGAIVCRRLNDIGKAVQLSHRAMHVEPGNIYLTIEYSNNLIKLGKLDEAEAVLEGVSDHLKQDKHYLLHLSKILYQKQEYELTVRHLVNLVKQYPNFAAAHMELAHALLMHGKWFAGWQEYEWRYRMQKTQNTLPKFRMPHWDGAADTPHILLIADQGYGDCFQFARYIPLVAQRCHRVSLIRSQPIARLMDSIPVISSSYMNWHDTPLTAAYSTLSGLPRLFATKPDTIPDCSGIIGAGKEDVECWRERLNTLAGEVTLKVGVAWSGRVEFEDNYLRAVPFEEIERLFEISGIQFFSLQVGTPASQAKGKDIIDLSTELTDFAETAAVMEGLDLIITSDTSVAHLAGTLGRPTWVLLNYAPDWRWGSAGRSSPWYQHMRLFRQDQTRCWGKVVSECKRLLNDIVNPDEVDSVLSTVLSESAN